MSNGSNSPGGFDERLMAIFWRKPAPTLAEQTRRRVALRLIPYLFFLYILAYLDRVNVSVAALDMHLPPSEGGMGFERDVIGFGAGVFFWGYWILEIPSTVSVVRWGASWVFMRILILWGICAALVGFIGTPFASSLFTWMPHLPEHTAFIDVIDGGVNALYAGLVDLARQFFALKVQPPAQPLSDLAHFINGLAEQPVNQFYFFRFMLGFFEGGFFPSVIVYLSLWFRTEDRAKAIASFMSAIPISSMLGVPLSGLLLGVDWLGLPGWRWIFILEGVAPVLAGFTVPFFLPNRPSTARWLPAAERSWLLAELEREQEGKKVHGHWAWVHNLGMVLLLTGVYFCLNLTSYGLSMFMPAIIKSQSGATSLTASLLASLPYVMALIAMLVNGWHSDRTGERIFHVAVPLSLLSLGIFLTATLDGIPVIPVVTMIFCVGTFMYSHLPAFWPIPTMFLGATAAASAIGFINMIGNLGGSVGPWIVGNVSTGDVSFSKALYILAPWPLGSAAIIVIVGFVRSITSAPKQPVLTASDLPAVADPAAKT